MKFTDGYWGLREGVQLLAAADVDEVRVEGGTMTVFAPCKPIESRGDTLGLPMLTFTFDSPMEDVIHVRMVHFKGGHKKLPEFAVERDPALTPTITQNEESASLRSGKLEVRVKKGGPWGLDFLYEGRRITGTGPRHSGHVIDAEGGRYMREQLSLGVGESLYGLGERFTAFVKNGQVVDMWNEDGGTSSEQAYKNIPFYLSSAGYGVFVASPDRVSFELASEVVTRAQFSVPGEELEYYIIGGANPKEVLTRYTALTGRPALPPAWSFGLWLTTSFTTSYDEASVAGFVDGMRDRKIPLHTFHFDCFWMKGFQWCDFEWDSAQFPDPEGFLRRLKARGLRICVWINPYIAQKARLFQLGMARGYLVKRPDGSVWQWDRWQAGMGLVDFTNTEANAWFKDCLRALVRMGVDCFKSDFGERIPTDVAWHDGCDPQRMHNYYTQLYNKAVFEVLEEEYGKGQALVFARSATAGGQKFPVHWGGDCSATFESMAESLRGGLSLGLSGFGFWSHDISGFEKTATADLYKRWSAFGLLSSHSRLHGNESYRVPWLFDEEACDVLRFFVNLKCSLMPHLFAVACEAAATGLPMMRAMLLEFPDDPTAAFLDRQYMLGDSLLVAPIFCDTGSVTYYLPAGRWTRFLSGERVEGGQWRTEKHGYLSLPLMARPGSIIAVGADDSRPDYDYAQGVTFHVFELEVGRSVSKTLFDSLGKEECSISVERGNQGYAIRVLGATKPWRVCLRNVVEPASVEGGSFTLEAQGAVLTPTSPGDRLTVRLGSATAR